MSLERAEAIRQHIRMTLRKAGASDIYKSHRLSWHGMLVVYYPTSDTFNWFKPGHPRTITRTMNKQAVLDFIAAEMETQP